MALVYILKGNYEKMYTLGVYTDFDAAYAAVVSIGNRWHHDCMTCQDLEPMDIGFNLLIEEMPFNYNVYSKGVSRDKYYRQWEYMFQSRTLKERHLRFQ